MQRMSDPWVLSPNGTAITTPTPKAQGTSEEREGKTGKAKDQEHCSGDFLLSRTGMLRLSILSRMAAEGGEPVFFPVLSVFFQRQHHNPNWTAPSTCRCGSNDRTESEGSGLCSCMFVIGINIEGGSKEGNRGKTGGTK